MNRVKYVNPSNGDRKIVKITQTKITIERGRHSEIGGKIVRHVPFLTLAMANKAMYKRGYIRASA